MVFLLTIHKYGLPGGSVVKNSFTKQEITSNAGDTVSVCGSGRSPGERNGNPLQCSCLENPRDGEAWWAAVYGVTQSWTRLKRLSRRAERGYGEMGDGQRGQR